MLIVYTHHTVNLEEFSKLVFFISMLVNFRLFQFQDRSQSLLIHHRQNRTFRRYKSRQLIGGGICGNFFYDKTFLKQNLGTSIFVIRKSHLENQKDVLKESLFHKFAGCTFVTLLNRNSYAGFFLRICAFFQKIFFIEYLVWTAFNN